jgi:N6-L-threonylcarbamoyladenine synthase
MPALHGFNYSFSGVKTAFLNFLTKQLATDPDFLEKEIRNVAASYQDHLINYLLKVFLLASKEHGIKDLAIAGGVSANSGLRMALQKLEEEGYRTYIPKFEYTTDNAAMIGIVGYYKFLKKDFTKIDIPPFTRAVI